MLRNYLIIAWRHLWRNKSFSLWNIFGLAFGIGGASLIFLLIQFELSFDRHHPQKDKIFRVVMEDNANGDHKFTQAIPYPLPAALREDFGQIEALTIVDANVQNPIITISNGRQTDKYKEERGFAFIDPDYFQLFPYEWVLGNPRSALSDQKTVVLSESLAAKYFGNKNPLGQLINFDNQFDLKVTGVVKDAPKNTDLPFNMLISMNLGEEDKRGWEGWDASSGRVHCYLKLQNIEDEVYLNQQLESYFGEHWHEEYAKDIHLFLQPLSDLHFDTRFANFNARVVSMKTIWALGLIGLFLLVTSCINFINLNTVLAVQRSKEIGVRKVLGGQRGQLVTQFLGETFVVTTIAVLGALLIIRLGFLHIQDFLGYGLNFNLASAASLTLFLLGILVLVCALAGLYPALLMSGFRPIAAIKNNINISSKWGFSMRSSLVIAQLVISQILVICTLVVANQLKYFNSADLGFNKETIVEFPMPVRGSDKVDQMANSLSNNPMVTAMSFTSTGAASDDSWGGDFTFNNGQEIITRNTFVKFIDEDFLNTYGVRLRAGKNLRPADSANMFLVNESFVKAMGLSDAEQAVGRYVKFWGIEAPITGVIKDFNATSLHHPIKACIFMVGADSYHQGAVKILAENMPQTIKSIEEAWTAVYHDYIFEYHFLDET
ncbi:MAG: ABC transporter permease, partial [Cyclobacteriaceae bacterium]